MNKLLKVFAVRSKMGIWVYYVGTLSFREVNESIWDYHEKDILEVLDDMINE